MDWMEEGRRKGGVRDFICNFDLNERLNGGRDGEFWGKNMLGGQKCMALFWPS